MRPLVYQIRAEKPLGRAHHRRQTGTVLSNLALFLGACLVVAMVPGPSTAVILRQAVRDGRRAAFAATLGNETGVLLWGAAAAFGLTALIAASELAYDTLRVVGVIVLLYLGAQALLTARQEPGAVERQPRRTAWRSYRAGVATIVANPKAAVFAMSFLPQFVPDGAPMLPPLLALAGLWAVVDLVWYAGLIWLVSWAKAGLARPGVRRRLEQVSGVVLIGLGVRLAVDSR